MIVDFIHIQNFRKLQDCRIDFSDRQTVFVGPNNSGKTSAMDALMIFFKQRSRFTTREFTLSNWAKLNEIGAKWLAEEDPTKIDLTIKQWESYLPTLDVWLNVKNSELQHVSTVIPTLDWKGGLLGIRLRFEPINIEELYKEYVSERKSAKSIVNGRAKGEDSFELWPKDMWDFLDHRLKHFSVKSYLLNPDLKDAPQQLGDLDVPMEGDPLSNLIKVDIINAQRGFSDTNSELSSEGNTKHLSAQLRGYYDKHLNPSLHPTEADVVALQQIHNAKELFDKTLSKSFASALEELESLNYPGFGNPKIKLSSKINTMDSLQHESSVRYVLDEQNPEFTLPEKYNGLGYQNLISMLFKLICFRDEWMKVGKSYNQNKAEDFFEPIHLVLIEEPEAHLHAQVQQVFAKEAYKVLRKHKLLGDDKKFETQVIVSTHSNHVAHEVSFMSLRYFKRQIEMKKANTSKVINLSKTFGTDDDTSRFSKRYLKTTHSDLFFADAVIMVEGPAERMLVPYFIQKHTKLNNCYVSILEIGGSHAYRLRPLIENLGLITLIISDIDSVDSKTKKRVHPAKGKGYVTGNSTLKVWSPAKENIDSLLDLKELEKIHDKFPVRVAYQMPVEYKDGAATHHVYPYTFEDSLVLENKSFFKDLTEGTGLLKKMIDAAMIDDFDKAAEQMYENITGEGVKKAEFALELLYLKEPKELQVPKYIKEGLDWLEDKLIVEKVGLKA